MSGEGLIAEPRSVHVGVGTARLAELMHRGTEFLGCELAILGGAMSWVSERNLVSAISNAGGFGVIACGAMTPDLLDTEIAETKKRTDEAVRRQPHHHAPDAVRADRRLRQARVTHVVLAGGLPPGGAIDRIKAQRRQADRLRPRAGLAKKLIRSGADALVIEGMEAGGHIGPVSTSVLAQEILPHVAHDMPVFVAGGIGRGEAIAAYLEMGAVGVQLGTRFVCANECDRPPQFQEGLHPRLGARRGAERPDRPAPAGDPGPRAQEPRDREPSPPSSARSPNCSTRARSKWPRRSSRSSIIGPERCAAR